MGKGFGISTKAQLDMASVNQVKKEFTALIKDLQKFANENYVSIRVNQTLQQVQNFNNQLNNTRTNVNNVNGAMNNLNDSNRTFAQQMTHVISKVAQWTLGMTAVYGTISKIKEGFSFIADIDKKLTDISMITGESKENLQEYAKAWNDTAIALKTTTDEVVDAEENFLRAGVSIDEANKMTETNIKLARVANDTNAQTSDYLVTLSNAYKLNADGVEQYANKVAYLDSSTATSTKNINKTAVAVAQTAMESGMSMDFMLGIVSTIQEKSKQAPESIGRALRSMLINMQNVTREGGAELSKLEEILNKRGIALRKNEKEWRSSEAIIKDLMVNWNKLDDISKSAIQSKLAGKVGAESFNIIMNDQTRVMENYNSALNATNTLNEKYEKHLDSTAGATAELQAKTEKMWLKLIDSSTIVNGIKLLIKTVTIIDELANHNRLLGLGLLALSAQFIGLIRGVNLFGMALTALKGLSLATFTALATNPLTWIAVAIGGVIALTNHLANQREEAEKLTQEYKDLYTNLTTAMKENNLESVKSDTDSLIKKQTELADLLAKRKEIQDSVNKNPYDNTIDVGIDNSADWKDTNDQIETLTTTLKKAGFTVNETTGEIIELSQAQGLLKNKEIVDGINTLADSEMKNKQKIIELIQEYQTLNAIENKNSVQKERLSQLSQILSSEISGLTTTRDKEGNVIIQNASLLDKEISILNTEGATVQTLAKVKLEHAKQDAEIQIGMTKMTYAKAKERIEILKAEASAYGALARQYSDAGINMGVRDSASKELGAIESAIKAIDEIYGGKNSLTVPSYGSSSDEGFTPPSDGSSGKDKTPTIFNASPLNRYDSAITTINNSLQTTDDKISTISQKISNLQSLESKSNYAEIIDAENEKLKEQQNKLTQLGTSKTQAKTTQDQIKNQFYSLIFKYFHIKNI